jgi:hypothetical protein
MTGPGADPIAGPPEPEQLVDRTEATRLARGLIGLIDSARAALPTRADGSAAVRAITAHLGTRYDQAILVSTEVPTWQQASAHVAASRYLDRAGQTGGWFGVASLGGMHRQHTDLVSLLHQDAESGSDRLAPAEYTSAATGPDTTAEVVDFGLVLTSAPSGTPVMLALRTSQYHGRPAVAMDVLAAVRQDAAALLDELLRLINEFDVVRGQVVSFSASEHFGNELVSFLPRPRIDAQDVVLPDGVLASIERHVVGPATRAERLKELGVHLKRGLLLHGPPGTGKTHTVRYLMGRLRECTVIVLSGTSLRFIEPAAALARRLTPSVLVVEDVDLVATDRSFSPSGNPLLFTLLDAMDGVAADADVTFVLTTNRAADLETALVERPGRIDLAVEIPRPDVHGRRLLFDLYRGTAAVTADLEPAVALTDGATASAIKELMRRAILAAIEAEPDADPPVVDDEVLRAVLDDFSSERESLSRSLLGGTPPASDASGDFTAGPGHGGGPGLAPGSARPIIRPRSGHGWTAYRPL